MTEPKNNPPQTLNRLSIKKKITLFFCLTILIIVSIGISAGYFSSYQILHDSIGQDYEKMAENLAISTSGLLEMITEDVGVYLTDSVHTEAILDAVKRYGEKNEGQIKEYFLRIDKEWVPAKSDSALVSEYTHSKSGERLGAIVSADRHISELFITDRFGGLVATSGKTSDFYQADEEWWQKAYNHGKGDVYASDVEYDLSSETIALAIAIPIKNSDDEVIGVAKAIVETEALFEPIGNFKIDKTGHAILIDGAGMIIFHEGMKPLSKALCDNKEFTKIISGQRKFAVLSSYHSHQEKRFTAFATVKYPPLLKNGITWRIFIIEDEQEVFSPLNKLFFLIALISTIVIITSIPFVLIFSSLFIKPILELHKAVEHIKQGNFNYALSIKTGDEIEALADSFKEMSGKISSLLNNLQSEIAEREKTEKNLRISEENYHTIFEAVNDAIIIADRETYKIVETNKRACEMLNYSKEDILGMKLVSLDAGNSPDLNKKFEDFNMAGDNKLGIFEWFIKDRFGRKFWVESSSQHVTIRGKSYLLFVMRNIAERKQQLE